MASGASDRFTRFVERRLRIAGELAHGTLNGTNIEAYVLVSAVLSAMAAFLWPGQRKDRVRFVELWVRYAARGFHPDTVSVPLLLQQLNGAGDTSKAAQLVSLRPEIFRVGEDDRVLIGPDVDVTEGAVRRALGQSEVRRIREFSYANLFYSEVRSAVVHELTLGVNVTDMPMAIKSAPVSYSNLLEPGKTPDSRRQIYFCPRAIIDTARSIAEFLDHLSIDAPLAEPNQWWLHGG